MRRLDSIAMAGLVLGCVMLGASAQEGTPVAEKKIFRQKPLLIGSGVSPKAVSPALKRKIRGGGTVADALKDRKPYGLPYPAFGYHPHAFHVSEAAEETFKKSIDFIVEHIKPYASEAIVAGGQAQIVIVLCTGDAEPENDSLLAYNSLGAMKRQTAYLREKGLVPGRWTTLARFFVDAMPKEAAEEGWFDEKDVREFKVVMSNGKEKLVKAVTPDYKNPKVLKWVEDAMDKLVHEVGWRYFWLDWGSGDLELYRAARRGCARHGHKTILRCGAGGMRPWTIEVYNPGPDVHQKWICFEQIFYWRIPDIFPQFYKHVCTMGFCSFFVNQPFSTDQVEFSATMFALTGMEITELATEFYKTPLERMRFYQKILPLPNVEPLDFTPRGTVGKIGWAGRDRESSWTRTESERKALRKREDKVPRAWALFISRPFEKWHVVGFFNPRHFELEQQVFELKHLALNENDYTGWDNWTGKYLAWDFWGERFLGVFEKEMNVRLAPSSCLAVALRRETGRPQILSTDRHITQGGVEIEDCKWSEKEQKLTGSFRMGVKGKSFYIFVYVPANYGHQSSGGDVAEITKIGDRVIRVKLKPEEKPAWDLVFEKTGPEVEEKVCDGRLLQNRTAELIEGSHLALKGDWFFKEGGRTAGLEKADFGSPGWQKLEEDAQGRQWTMAQVMIPSEWKGQGVRLYYRSKGTWGRLRPGRVYLNGVQCKQVLNPAGRRATTTTPTGAESVLDLTEAARYGEDNTLTVYRQPPGFRRMMVGLQIDLKK